MSTAGVDSVIARSDQGTDSGGMSPLQALILNRMRELGLSPKQVENRGVTHATLHRYMNPVRMSSPPRRAVMQSLATALDVDLAEVERAAVASVGYAYDRQDTDHAPMTRTLDFPDRLRIVRTVYHQLGPEETEDLDRQIEAFARTYLALRQERKAAEGDGG